MRTNPKNRAPPAALEVTLPEKVVEIAIYDQPLLSGLVAVGAGFSPKAEGSFRSWLSRSDQATFIYCVNGVGWCEVAGALHTVRAGDLLVLRPRTLQSYGARGANAWTIHWVQARGPRVTDYLREVKAEAHCPIVRVGEDPQVARLFGEILRSLQRGSSFAHLLHASSALAYVLALLIQKRQERRPEDSDTLQRIAEAIIFMSEHLGEPLRVSALARAASLSPAYFSELFKLQTGCSPREYLHLLRIHRACQLLQDTSLSVKQIAGRLGYQDQFHFSRQFKAFQGLSPTEYRESGRL